MKRIGLIVVLIALVLPSGVGVRAQDGGECDADAVATWITARQALRGASQTALDTQGVSVQDALALLAGDLQRIEDLERPACADEAMLWTYWLYTNLEHLLICAGIEDAACVTDMQARLTDYRTRDDEVMHGLVTLAGLSPDVLVTDPLTGAILGVDGVTRVRTVTLDQTDNGANAYLEVDVLPGYNTEATATALYQETMTQALARFGSGNVAPLWFSVIVWDGQVARDYTWQDDSDTWTVTELSITPED